MAGEQSDKGADLDQVGQAEIEGRVDAPEMYEAQGMPAAWPQAKPSLVNPEATPGTGILPSAPPDDEAAAGTG